MAKVLIIDDDSVLCDSLAGWLQLEGHTVETAGEGEDALQMLSNYQYDVIVLDWGLPTISGLDVLKRYRRNGGITPIIFLTGQGDVQSKKDGLDSGAEDYLTKPFASEELSARIRSLLRRPAALVPSVVTIGAVGVCLNSKQVTVSQPKLGSYLID